MTESGRIEYKRKVTNSLEKYNLSIFEILPNFQHDVFHYAVTCESKAQEEAQVKAQVEAQEEK